MTTIPPLPPTHDPVLDETGQFTLAWRKWFQQGIGSVNLSPAQIAALETAVAAAQATANKALADALAALSASGGLNPLALLSVLNPDPQQLDPLVLLSLIGADLTFIGGSAVLLNGQALATVAGQGVINLAGAVSFGTGAPVALVVEGATYYDTTAAPYTQYVQHSGAWHQVA